MAASQSLSGGWTQSKTAHRPSAFPFWVNAQGIILLNPVSVADDVTSENLHKIMWLLMMLIGAINKAGCHESFESELYIADRLVQALTAVHRQVQYHVLQVCV